MLQSIALLCCGKATHTPVDSKPSGLNPDGPATDDVVDVLKSGDFTPVICMNWRRFRHCAAGMHAAVIVASHLDLDGTAAGLRETTHDDFPCPLILVTSSEPENLRQLGPVRVTYVVFLDEVNRRLVRVLSSVAFAGDRLLLCTAIRRREMHITLRRALLALVNMSPLEPGYDGRPARRFPRTIDDLAKLARMSTTYLHELAREARLPLGRILHRYAAIRALEMIAAAVPQEVIADSFGYEDISGVRKLITRNLGSSPGKLIKTGVQLSYTETAIVIEKGKTSSAGAEPRSTTL